MKKILFYIGFTSLSFLAPNASSGSGSFPSGKYKPDHEGKPFTMEFKTDGDVNGYSDGDQILIGTYRISEHQFTWEWVSTCKEIGYRVPTTYNWNRNYDGSITFQLVGEDECDIRKEVFDQKTYGRLISS